MSSELDGQHAKAIIEAWRALARHVLDCEPCEGVVRELARVPDVPHPLYDRCCAPGRELFGAWTEAKAALCERFRQLAAPWGIGALPAAEAEARARAITAMPAPAAVALYHLPDQEAREAQIRALVAAQARTGAVVVSGPAGERECELPGCRSRFVPPPRRPSKRYCTEAHYREAQRSDRPKLALVDPGEV